MSLTQAQISVIDALVERYRTRCLWSVRPDYLPPDDAARLRALRAIMTHGDREAFLRAAEAKAWLSPPTNAASARS